MAAESPIVELGTPAPDFTLPATSGATVSLSDLTGTPALLVAFICNHCPYVQHMESELGRVAAAYDGLATVGISANDVTSHPDDDLPRLAEQAERAGFTFPYLYDESQDVARAYGAACTPDLFLYDADRRLAYRGEFDPTRPNSGQPATGASLRTAIEHVLAGEPAPPPQRPSIGCSIKWR
ncbi:MAG: thioredoxin family protein [Ilumatobacteraceae bacterium]